MMFDEADWLLYGYWYEYSSSKTIILTEGRDTKDYFFETQDNFIYAKGGFDQIWGSNFDDTIYKTSGGGYFDGGDGHDTLNFYAAVRPVYLSLEGGVGTLGGNFLYFNNFEEVAGSRYNDILVGSDDENVGDVINGNDGFDQIYGGAGNDSLNGGFGTDVIHGDDDDDWIVGHFGDDYLYGGEGDDSIYASFGDDYINGGPGADLLVSGYGADVFVFDIGDSDYWGGVADTITAFGIDDTIRITSTALWTDPRFHDDGSASIYYRPIDARFDWHEIRVEGDLASLGNQIELGVVA